VVRRIDRDHRETAGLDEVMRVGDEAGGLLVLAPAVSHQDQRTRAVEAFRCPQHAGDLVEGEELFGDAVVRRLGAEAHS
jgi:hypothetical protein